MGKSFDEDDFKNMLEKASDKNHLIINTSYDEILSHLSPQEVKPVEVADFRNFTIEHEMFDLFYELGIIDNLFLSCNSQIDLHNRILGISLGYWERIEQIIDSEYTENKMKGDLFEIWGELFFKLTSTDNRVGVSNYKPVSDHEDYGVDGTGIGINGRLCTVQIKFKSNILELLTIDDLKNFQGLSYRKYGVDVNDDNNLIILTNCQGVHWKTETRVLENSIVTYGNYGEEHVKSLQSLTDNMAFWNGLRDFVDYAVDKKGLVRR